ncbi:hypothetical protein [Rathayibacter toxicus]|uniref:Uncharacterized protein n=1 Tax=Rathayibacter toxicus TaxID=145458 RepID=A0A0C5BHK9_9MICO|nr:hypothetical protein [Rathayibacter toxicus]AJM77750.1 hypothetical protein TI83_06925 [Rathayibacter toxicus]ALS58084.1 hypothetical protein APU90_10165 [Rathayibacter toxicus]KKM45295.1 hypothetical protein VT73_06550 [Rathayibacter toxicus]PPG21884.1 hypothetical protein C5D15_06740 [Rathayibacter toxicus]PPG46846.1 hypothetical protein C5D16_06715 [Rathayibacter toxicus]
MLEKTGMWRHTAAADGTRSGSRSADRSVPDRTSPPDAVEGILSSLDEEFLGRDGVVTKKTVSLGQHHTATTLVTEAVPGRIGA